MNEALTDIVAARIYSSYAKKKYGGPRRYRESYGKSAKRFHKALEILSRTDGVSVGKAFYGIEAGFFFLSDETAGPDSHEAMIRMAEHFVVPPGQ